MLISSIQGNWCSELYAHIKKVLKMRSGEVKVLIISCYYAIFAVFIVTTFTITNVQKHEQFTSDITTYFMCEAAGTVRECDKSFVDHTGDIFTILSIILIGLFPIVNLIYVLNIRELKQKISKYFPKSKRQITRNSNGVVTSADVTQKSYLSSEY